MTTPPPLVLQEDVDLAPLTTFRVPARARWFVRLDEPSQLALLHQLPVWADVVSGKLPLLMLGGGSNILFTKDFAGLVLLVGFRGITTETQGDDAIVTAAAGENWDGLVRYCVDAGLGGIENLALIPGSVGAAPVQNIGAYGVELEHVFLDLTAWDFQAQAWVVLDHATCQFGYRDSLFKRAGKGRYLITTVRLKLSRRPQVKIQYAALEQELANRVPGPQGWTIRDIADAVTAVRRSKLPDPAVIGNAGSFFKNPVVRAEQAALLAARYPSLPQYPQADGTVKLAAGWLIEQAGWKGKRLGAAAVHDRQALVLVNPGHATGADVAALAEQIQRQVFDQFHIRIKAEVNIL